MTKYLLLFLASTFVQAAPKMHTPGRIGLIQYNGDKHFGDRKTNIQNLTKLATDAVRGGAKIIVTPEGSTDGYAKDGEIWCAPENIGPDGLFVATQRTHDSVANRPIIHTYKYTGIKDSLFTKKCRDISPIAEAVPSGAISKHWIQFSKKHKVYTLYQVPEKDGDKYYVTIGIAGPNGFVAKYRKRALYWVDDAYATSGTEELILKTEYGNFGLLLCRDATYNTHFYDDYIQKGVNGLIIPMDWDDDPNDPEISARATFQKKSAHYQTDIFVSDQSPWDGTAAYLASSPTRVRSRGLSDQAVNQDGVVLHNIHYEVKDSCINGLQK